MHGEFRNLTRFYMTFDATSPLGIPTEPTTSPNSRTAKFDLDSVVRGHGISDPTTVFLNARLLTTWHYQWMIVHEFLALFVGQAIVADILANGPQIFDPRTGQGFIPVEFQTGSYRFGHSMVRPSYRANFTGDPNSPFGVAPAFFGLTFDPSQHPEDAGGKPLTDPSDLSGGARDARISAGLRAREVDRDLEVTLVLADRCLGQPD